ncbi:hypothetical protein WR25_21844 [Diploscapter pachys]|uniref:Uncharacterized protein n=1 Tax=Diploscapter pachys TaxID=2018661 RepID=A0A2A2LR87_9BILA|nr:hypothetical protein WR25_21844 [Diploscapter pachys]
MSYSMFGTSVLNQTERAADMSMSSFMDQIDQQFNLTMNLLDSAVPSRDVKRWADKWKAHVDTEEQHIEELKKEEETQREELKDLAEQENLLDLKIGRLTKDLEVVEATKKEMLKTVVRNDIIVSMALNKFL